VQTTRHGADSAYSCRPNKVITAAATAAAAAEEEEEDSADCLRRLGRAQQCRVTSSWNAAIRPADYTASHATSLNVLYSGECCVTKGASVCHGQLSIPVSSAVSPVITTDYVIIFTVLPAESKFLIFDTASDTVQNIPTVTHCVEHTDSDTLQNIPTVIHYRTYRQ
jgi:hypothetical protein